MTENKNQTPTKQTSSKEDARQQPPAANIRDQKKDQKNTSTPSKDRSPKDSGSCGC